MVNNPYFVPSPDCPCVDCKEAIKGGWTPPPTEQELLMKEFSDMLWLATGDGAAKRSAGLKQPWWRDTEHEAAIFSHLSKWKHGELTDDHSGAHPLVHLAWRALAIAYQESRGKTDPQHRGVNGIR